MKELENKYTQLEVLQEFEISETAILAGTVHSVETIALKRVCENLKIDWHGQRQRLLRNKELNELSVRMKQIGSDGKQYDMLCLPIKPFQLWLRSLLEVNSDTIDKDLLNKYLYNLVVDLLWAFKSLAEENQELREAANTMREISGDALLYQEIESQESDLMGSLKDVQKQLSECTKKKNQLKDRIFNTITNQLNLFHSN